nr:hypothetical protein [Tanacetum cinerariifolium]
MRVSCLLLFSTILSCSASVLWISVGSTGVVALECCFPLAVADSRGADSTMVVGVGVGGVVEEAESPFFFLALALCLGAASPIAQAWNLRKSRISSSVGKSAK